MDARRVERLLWSVVFASLLALSVAFLLAPDPTGLVALVVGAAAFAAGVALSVRLFERSASPTAAAGDLTVQFVTFFAVTLALRLGLDALGFGGAAAHVASFAVGWVAARYGARRLNPLRRRGGTTA
jgi:hypothetical protein